MFAPRHIAAWIVGTAYVALSSAIAVTLLRRDSADTAHTIGWCLLACALAIAIGVLVHHRFPRLGAGLLMSGALVLAAGAGLVAAFLAAWSEPAGAVMVAWGLFAALLVASPALLTGVAVIRGRSR